MRPSVYVAGSSEEIGRVRHVIETLQARGIRVTHDWPAEIRRGGGLKNKGLTYEQRRAAHIACDRGVRSADIVLLLVSKVPSFGAGWEASLAHECRIPLFVAGDAETSIFLHNCYCTFITDAKAVEAIGVLNSAFLYRASEGKEETDAALDHLIGTLDDLHLKGDFAETDRVLREIDITRLNTDLIVGLLMIARPAEENGELREFKGFARRARTHLHATVPDRAARILHGLILDDA